MGNEAMQAQQWHDFCHRAPPPEPAHLNRKQWHALSGSNREAHLAQLEWWLSNLYVNTDQLDVLCKKWSETLRYNAISHPGAKSIIGLSGPNVIGKTTVMMHWARDRYLTWTRDAEKDRRGRPVYHSEGCEHDLIPVVWIGLHAATTRDRLDSAILHFYNLPGNMPSREMTHCALLAARRHKARVLILDDVHWLRRSPHQGREVLDHIKRLNSELGLMGATVILIGADLENQPLADDPQIAGRLRLDGHKSYDIDDDEDQKRWQKVVRQLEDAVLPHLPAGKPGMLFTNLPVDLHDRTQGYIGDLVVLIGKATLAAATDGSHRIVRRHLDGVELDRRAEQAFVAKR
jgi:hypothetical protein